jgi:hypothetical protein
MEVNGVIKLIGKTEEVGASFKKRDIVVTTEEQYPQDISIQFVQDKCSLLDKFKVGESVSIGINLRGREWTSPQGEVKYFNTIQGWKINKEGDAPVNDAPFKTVDKKELNTPDNDLPF